MQSLLKSKHSYPFFLLHPAAHLSSLPGLQGHRAIKHYEKVLPCVHKRERGFCIHIQCSFEDQISLPSLKQQKENYWNKLFENDASSNNEALKGFIFRAMPVCSVSNQENVYRFWHKDLQDFFVSEYMAHVARRKKLKKKK